MVPKVGAGVIALLKIKSALKPEIKPTLVVP